MRGSVLKIGDLVECFRQCTDRRVVRGMVVGFNEKGEGGKEFVHVLCEGEVHVFMDFDIKVINPGKKG